MKRIIFRNPFVSKKNKRLALGYMKAAETLAKEADRCIKLEDITNATKLTIRSAEMWKLAAKRLGFRNIVDMAEYLDRHGCI